MKTVGIFIGPCYMKWDGDTVKNGIGGSETWAYEISSRLALAGYEVIMYADPEYDQHIYPNFHLLSYNRYFYDILYKEYDYFIFSRTSFIGYISPYLKCHNVYMMLHDTQIINNYNPTQIGIGRIKKYCYLSDWHKENIINLYKQYGINDSLLHKVSNGYSSEYYNNVDINNKTNSMVWSSSLTRGFDIFYKYIMFPILKEFPDFKLYVCCGTITDYDIELLNKASLLPGVEILNKCSKEELAKYQKQSKIWVYPGIFQETFCITAVENANAGNVIISPLSYGLNTTLENIEYLKEWNLEILNKENSNVYIDKIKEILINDDIRIELAKQCLEGCKDFNWDRATQDIIDMFEEPHPTEKDLYNYAISQINENEYVYNINMHNN